MSRHPAHRFSLSIAYAFGLWIGLGPELPLPAQAVVNLEAAPDAVSTCGTEVAVAVWLRGLEGPVGGYQVFLRFPAEQFEARRFEAATANEHTVSIGPDGFTGEGFEGGEESGGFAPCSAEVGDPWDDGMGEDVVAAAAILTEPAAGTEVLLGRFVFVPRETASAEPLVFALNEETCHPPLDQSTLLFDADGALIGGVEVASSNAVTVFDGTLVVEDLTCTDVDESTARLDWNLPAAVEAVEVHRDGVMVATLPGAAGPGFYEDTNAAGERLTYEVVSILAAGVEACSRPSCDVDRRAEVVFHRGDANDDGRINISDGVAILFYLFSGGAVTCLDAADADDGGDGAVALTDAVYVLNFIFREGAPFPLPGGPSEVCGPDPTDIDALGCDSYTNCG